tara:strand:- start:457 stop:1701 length:1245 start_codon:yes stop_codon:yes gene_type:complete
MAVITSDPILIDNKSFVTKTDGNTATVVRISKGKAITQTEKEVAGDFYNSTLDEIDYAKIYNLNFGANYLSKLGASDEWMASALGSKQYKDAFKKATNQSSSNISFASIADANLNWEPTVANTDANGKSTSSGTAKFLGRYPLNESHRVKYDYLQVTSLKHKANTGGTNFGTGGFAEAEERNMIPIGRVFLPMQPGLSESNSVNWNDESANAFQAAAFRVAQGTIIEPGGFGAKAKALMSSAIDESENMIAGISKSDIAAYFAGQAVGNASLFTRGSGKVLNPNLELLFGGPQLRVFNYNFRFTPREEREAREVKGIIKFFKKNMAPIRERGRLFLKTPNVFKLKYFFKNGRQHPFLNKIKICALRDLTVNYTPDGSYMTYDDGSMTSYDVTMTFGELNPIYQEDFDNSNDMGF